MDRSLKIVLTTFLVFFIYGLSGLFALGDFTTPIFLHQIALFFVATLLFVLNVKRKDSWILGLYATILLFACFIDGYTVTYLLSKTEANWIHTLYLSDSFAWVFLLAYFGFFLFLTFRIGGKHQQKFGAIALAALLMLTMTLLLLGLDALYRDLTFFIFLALYIGIVLKISAKKIDADRVLAHQFLLLGLLEATEYFQ